MKKVEKKVAEPKTEKQELKEAFALWANVSKAGREYYTGRAEDMKLIGYINFSKKNEKEPDIRVYSVLDDQVSDEQVASLWKTISKDDKLYLSGVDNEDKKLVGFYNDKFMEFPKRPFIRVYYKEEQETK